jgi:hypothetical protein
MMMGSRQARSLPLPRRSLAQRAWAVLFAGCFVGVLLTPGANAEDSGPPLHSRIDALIERARIGEPAPLASDGEFLRRIHLDLIGRVPDTATVREFLADESPSKRADMIERLLASPDHVRHLVNVFDVMLMERRPYKYVKQEEWENYLLESFAEQKPYHELVAELLASDGSEPDKRAAARFLLEREVEPNLLTRDISRVFFGRDIQCAQCHDHPLVDDYYQSEYYGLFAFVGRSSLFTDAKNTNTAYVAEKGEGDVSYKSVFTEIEGESRPQLLDRAPLEEPLYAPGDEYVVKPEKDVRPIPKYSRRARLAVELARGDHPAFRRNLANRLWAAMMGRGLVEPVDLHHSGNPPQHAEVLDLMADELLERQFNIRSILRELALTQAYQRSIEPATGWLAQIAQGEEQIAAIEARLREAVAAQQQLADTHAEKLAEIKALRTELEPLATALRDARQAEVAAAFAAREAQATAQATQEQLASRQEIHASVEGAAVAAQQAAEKLPDEKELAAAAAQFATKAAAIAEEVATLRTTAEEQRQTAETAVANADAARTALVEAEQKYTEPAAPLRAREAEAEELAGELERRRAGRLVVERQLARARAAQSRREPLEQLIAVQQRVQQLAGSRESLLGQIDALASQVTQQQNRLAQLQTELDKQIAEIAQRTEERKARAGALELLQTAGIPVTQAAAELPDDQELAAARELLQLQQRRLSDQVATLDRQLTAAEAERSARQQRQEEAARDLELLAQQRGELQRQLSELEAQLGDVEAESAELRKAAAVARQELEDLWTQQTALASLKSLSPEQLAWSILEATGVLAANRAAVEKELNEKPETAELDEAARAVAVEKGVYAKLQGSVTQFVRLFGGGPGQPQNEFFATVDQALFFANGSQLNSWLAPSGNNLTQRLLQLEDPAAMADELYLTVLTRRPTQAEREWIAAALAEHPDAKGELVKELAWALLTSAEFRFCP